VISLPSFNRVAVCGWHKVIGGCVNGTGVITIQATAIGMDTVLAGIIHMVDHAQASKLPVQKMVDKISSVFVPSVMGISALFHC
jgi:Cu+-exporting ATPase